MPDEALQAAFEIKAACDDISRKLLRWHWEEKPGAHSVDALMKHLAQRQKESPDYYERLPELNGRTGWQQLDTTLCMRVLLDPEKDAARPLDLLGNTPHPAAARRACNAVRMLFRMQDMLPDTLVNGTWEVDVMCTMPLLSRTMGLMNIFLLMKAPIRTLR